MRAGKRVGVGLRERFTPGAVRDPGGLLDEIISDYLAYYVPTPQRIASGVSGSGREEAPRRLAALFLPRMLHNPCLHATLLLRLAMRSPRFTIGLWRTLLIAKHSIDVQADIEIGPGLMLPHPIGIVFGWGLRIGRDVTILQGVTIGGVVGHPPDQLPMCPHIGDDVVIYMQSMVMGPIAVGNGAVIGAGAWVDRDVPPMTKIAGRARWARATEPSPRA